MAARHWIFIDVDPVRETDPGSDEELAAAESKYEAVLVALRERGIEPGMTAMSGNGYHIYVPVDGWPNDEEHNSLVKAFIGMLDAKFSDDRAKVDAATANPGRLAKIPGTVSRKGRRDGPSTVSHKLRAALERRGSLSRERNQVRGRGGGLEASTEKGCQEAIGSRPRL